MKKRHYPRTLQRRFYDWAKDLPVLGPVSHWSNEMLGPSTWMFWSWRMRARSRREAIEYYSTFMSKEEAERHYEANERGEARS